jgi:hypothetical protein
MRRVVIGVCIVFLVMWALPKFAVTRIEPWEIGVKRSVVGGVDDRDFEFGYQFAIPGYHRFYRLDRTLHFLDFNMESPSGQLEVRTRENNIIFADVSVVWRIKEGEGWKIVQEGLQESYEQKVRSTATGVLREGLASLSSTDVTQSEKRIEAAKGVLGELNEALAQYHVTADHVVIRGIRFRPEYEKKLQDKQYYIVQGKLDEALKNRSIAVQETDTVEKGIEKEIRLKEEEWNQKIEQLKTEFEIKVAEIEAGALRYDRQRRAEADAFYSTAHADGDLAEAKAEALGQSLKSQALASRAGRTYSAIQAAENFELGSIMLNSNDPAFLQKFGGMDAWRQFFLGK